ncbi:prevent-host-death family protein [Mesorhizobium sp. J18]|uniref:type II toxin-antitoxin system Phd/YefM family antitoxin n=1 Tax=Mesorhizobium sp. J18 TaxID=935263 RepID=UPI00119C10EC|nr:type II toxin-antitoxin system Phd/YefM family antitoxin [Mesorhizobium sp. J18]TWG89377.1 prevent-host-death family protein [Mesorhizobium sp. J18]
MRSFSLTDLSNKSGEVVEAAYTGPVEITRRGKRRFVLMSADQYDKLRNAGDPRRVYAAGETPRHLADAFASELEKLARGEGYDDPE